MTHYSENPGMVRVDYFKPSGKWYMTEALDMSKHYGDPDIHKAVRETIAESRPERSPDWFEQFTVVVLEPYHQNAYPIMLVSR